MEAWTWTHFNIFPNAVMHYKTKSIWTFDSKILETIQIPSAIKASTGSFPCQTSTDLDRFVLCFPGKMSDHETDYGSLFFVITIGEFFNS